VDASVLKRSLRAIQRQALHRDAPEMLSGGGFDVERHLSSEVIEFVENFFVLLGRDHMMVEPSSHRDEKEYAPEGDILGSENVCDIPNFFLVELGNGGIDLDFQADLPCIPNRVHGPNEAAIHAAESIVIFTIVAVQADGEADQAASFIRRIVGRVIFRVPAGIIVMRKPISAP